MPSDSTNKPPLALEMEKIIIEHSVTSSHVQDVINET